MLKMKNGIDILTHVGGVKNIEQAKTVFDQYMDEENRVKLLKIKTEDALIRIANGVVLGEPARVFVDTGSEADKQWIRDYSLEKGEEEKLAMKDHTVHFDLPQDQARLINQTYYIVNEDDEVNSLAKSMPRQEALEYIEEYMKGIMENLTLMIGFFSRGPVGAQAAIPAIELSTSAYVLHSAELLYRNCYNSFDSEVKRKGIYFTNVHSEGQNRPEDIPKARIFMDRSWQTTFSTYCTYAGNTLLLKKGNHRFAVDYSVYFMQEEELSEHMFITGMTGPGGRKTFIAGAAPSGCGKTTTAMVGSDFIGDDLAQLWIAEDGTLRAVNPEHGVFGIVEDVNREGDPYLMKCLREPGTEVIWTNVLIDENKKPHWVGHGEKMPDKGYNYQGEWYKGKKDDKGYEIPPSSKNARCTLLCEAIENNNKEAEQDPAGVPVKVITYSGRDSDTMPPVWVGKNSDEGVVIGASVVSQATATEIGASGVRRQPWANAPFIPGSVGDYMDAHFKFFGSHKYNEKDRPIIAGLNYFLTHENRGGNGEGLLGEKKDVHVWLGWLELYSNGDVEAIETPIGFIPKYDDLKLLFNEKINKQYPYDLYRMQFSLYIDNIIKRIELQEKTYQETVNIPQKLFDIYKKQKKELKAVKKEKGNIVPPQKL
ncbi:MAG: phosphoenolpyruvate carboxykinase (GTP) [Verrucomicrobiota bacterium]